LQKEGFEHLAKSYSYNYCEYYEEIPRNIFFDFLFKKSIFGQNPAGVKSKCNSQTFKAAKIKSLYNM
jgi:hypothetical protein